MNLGHAIGSAVREQIRDATPARNSPAGFWHQIGRFTMEQVRTIVEELAPVRFEAWQTQNDERTCPICGALDGQVWQADEGFVPPVHDHCRCERVYHHTEFRVRLVEHWQDVAVPRFSWEWRTR